MSLVGIPDCAGERCRDGGRRRSRGRRSSCDGRHTLGPVSAFYRVLIAAAVLIPWRLAVTPALAPTRPRLYGPAPRALDCSRGRRILRARSGVVEHRRHADAGGDCVAARQSDAGVRRTALLIVPPAGRADRSGSEWSSPRSAAPSSSARISTPWSPPGTLIGDIAIVASVFFAAYLLTTERVRVSDGHASTFNTLAITGGSVVTLRPHSTSARFPLTGYPSRTGLALARRVSLTRQLGAYYALVYDLGHLPATVTLRHACSRRVPGHRDPRHAPARRTPIRSRRSAAP